MSIALQVNGQAHTVDAAADTPLLYVLRDDLQLNAPKFGCGLSQCGACTVHLGNRAVRSCVTPLSDVGDQPVTTLEGLGSPNALHPVQQAFVDEQAAQRNPQPSPDDIKTALNGNLCRCGAHMRIIRAVQRAAGTLPA